MKLSIKKIVTSLAVVSALVLSGVELVGGAPAVAAPTTQVCKGVDAALGDKSCDAEYTPDTLWSRVRVVINWLLIIAGLVAVAFIIFGGIRYITSSGEAERVKKAKSTILYAVIGLVIAALALVIVNLALSVGDQIT